MYVREYTVVLQNSQLTFSVGTIWSIVGISTLTSIVTTTSTIVPTVVGPTLWARSWEYRNRDNKGFDGSNVIMYTGIHFELGDKGYRD